MSIPKRKIGFYALQLKDFEDDKALTNTVELKNVINYIDTLNKDERIYDIARSNKFHILDSIEWKNDIHRLVFISAKYYHRPPLIDKDTASERENPKELTEGETEKTHIGFKYLNDEILVLLEERKAGISIGVLIRYLMRYLKRYYKEENKKLDFYIDYSVIPKGDFLEELSKFKRATFGNIYVNKKLLGSDPLNYSHRLENAQDNLIITVKAKKRKSIKEIGKDVYNWFVTEGTNITKIRIYGFNEEGNQIFVDTDIVKKIEYLVVDLDDTTGIVNSNDIFNKFENTLNNMEE